MALFTVIQLARLWWSVRRERRLYRRTKAKIDAIRARSSLRPGAGMPLTAYDELAQLFESIPQLAQAWHAYDSQHLIQRSNQGGNQTPQGEDQIWAPGSAETAFSDAAVVDSRINRSFYLAIPGLVTGLGLLLTFVAILIALMNVRVEADKVVGLEGLVAGLSGKFVSSVVALLLASVFLISERSLLHRLGEGRRRLVDAIDLLVPRRTELRVLSELHADMQEQSTAFRHFNTDLAGRLRQSFSESMGPTLQQMARTIEELNQLLRAAEAQKQESITGSLEAMLGRLENSLDASLDRMGQQFAQSLSGSATQQFDETARSLGGTARLLADMNAQFQGTQSALNELISFAKRSTAEQVALGRSQVEDLSTVLRQLMAQMQESAGTSLNTMTAALTGVVHDLSTKVSGLSDRMAATLAESAGHASSAAARVVEQADAWSQRSATQLAELLERHQAQVGRIEELRGLLENTLAQVRDSFGQYNTLTSELCRATADLQIVAGWTAESAEAVRQIHAGLQQVAQLSAAQVQHLAEANREQEESLRRAQQSLRQYEKSFQEVDRSAAALLTQIAGHLRDYTQTSRQGLDGMVQVSNELIANAVQKLGGSISELEDYLSELSDVLGRIRPH